MAIVTYKTRIGYEDIEWYQAGGSETFVRPTQSGGTITLHKVFGPSYPCTVQDYTAYESQLILRAMDDSTIILHQWGGLYYWMTQGNSPDALGIVFKV